MPRLAARCEAAMKLVIFQAGRIPDGDGPDIGLPGMEELVV